MFYQTPKTRKWRYAVRFTEENFDYLCEKARKRGISVAIVINELVQKDRKMFLEEQAASK